MEKQKRLEQTVLRIFGDLSLHSIQRNVLNNQAVADVS
jgi:hypothetical protein